MAEDSISIRTVLSEIYTSPDPFSLDFVAQDGSRKISKESVRVGGDNKQRSGGPVPAAPTRKGRRIKEQHRLFLYCNHEKHPFYVRICLLTHFNGLRIRHYYGKGAHSAI